MHSEGPVVLPHVWFCAYLILTESKSKKTLTWFAWSFNDTWKENGKEVNEKTDDKIPSSDHSQEFGEKGK